MSRRVRPATGLRALVPPLPPHLARGLWGYWPMTEGGGSQSFNAIGLGLGPSSPIAWSADMQVRPGRLGKAASFDTTYNGVISSGFGWPGGPVTVSWWNYVDTTASTPAAFGNNTGTVRFLCHNPYTDNNLYWDYGYPGTNLGRVSTSYAAYLSIWTYITLVSSGTTTSYGTAAPYQAIYFNGQLITSTTSVGDSGASSNMMFGGCVGGSNMHGGLQHMMIYNRVLPASEIAQLYAAMTPRPGLIVPRRRFTFGGSAVKWMPRLVRRGG